MQTSLATDMTKIMTDIIADHQGVIDYFPLIMPQIQKTAEKMIQALKNGGKIFWMGNGGSAADAQHMAAELIGRFKKERQALASIALTTDSSVLTSISNDYSFNYIFARQLEGLCKPQDIVMSLSTSGNSENVLQGVKIAQQIGAYTVSLTGHLGGKLKEISDVCFVMPSQITARIQEGHHLLCHILCELIDNKF